MAPHVKNAPRKPAKPGPITALETTVTEELTSVGRLETAVGQLALVLARRIDSGADTGAGLASLSRQLRDTMVAATANATEAESPLDKLRDELAVRRSGA